MALTLQPIRGCPQHSGETGTRLSSAIHRRLLYRFILREWGRLYTGYSSRAAALAAREVVCHACVTNEPQRTSAGRLAAALVSRVSLLRCSTLARACTPLTKSEEKERLLAVYVDFKYFSKSPFLTPK